MAVVKLCLLFEDLSQSDEVQIPMEEEIAVQSHIIVQSNSIISYYERGATTQATIATKTTSMADMSPETTVDVAINPGTPSEDVRSAYNSDETSSVIAAEIHVNVEIGYKATYDPRPYGPDLGPGPQYFA